MTWQRRGTAYLFFTRPSLLVTSKTTTRGKIAHPRTDLHYVHTFERVTKSHNPVNWLEKMSVTKRLSNYSTPTTFTCDQCVHHVVMDAFLNAKTWKTKILESRMNPRKSDEQDVVMNSSGIRLSKIVVSRVICIQKSVHHDVVGIFITVVEYSHRSPLYVERRFTEEMSRSPYSLSFSQLHILFLAFMVLSSASAICCGLENSFKSLKLGNFCGK